MWRRHEWQRKPSFFLCGRAEEGHVKDRLSCLFNFRHPDRFVALRGIYYSMLQLAAVTTLYLYILQTVPGLLRIKFSETVSFHGQGCSKQERHVNSWATEGVQTEVRSWWCPGFPWLTAHSCFLMISWIPAPFSEKWPRNKIGEIKSKKFLPIIVQMTRWTFLKYLLNKKNISHEYLQSPL